MMVGWVRDKSDEKKTLPSSGHAVSFMRTGSVSWIEAVQIYAVRYGTGAPPSEDFHLRVLNGEKQVIADVRFPYSLIESGQMKWYTLRTPSIEVPNQFIVALAFDPRPEAGISLGCDKAFGRSHSLTGLPESGFEPVKQDEEWMVRAYLAKEPTGRLGRYLLADWKPPVTQDVFKDCIEAKYDNGKSDGRESYGGRGPAIQLKPADFLSGRTPTGRKLSGQVFLKGLRVYGDRYGSGYNPENTMMKMTLLDSVKSILWQERVPYGFFSDNPKWVDIVLSRPFLIKEPEEDLIIALDPEAQQTRGIHFHYNGNLQKSHSLAGWDTHFESLPDHEWMIRAYFCE